MTRLLGFELLRPGLGWVALLSLAIAAAGLLAVVLRRRERALLAEPAALARIAPDAADGRPLARAALAAAAALFAALALVGPVRGWTEREVVTRGLDVAVAIDTSNSMLARDVRPSRLARALREVEGLLDVAGGDRIALVAFSGDAREVAPLTRDRSALRQLLARVSPEDNRRGGTDLAAAIERALDLVGRGGDGAHRAIVLVTDGEDHEGRAARLAREAGARGVRIFVVGVGTEGGGKIPLGAGGFLRDSEGREVVTRLDRASLARVAEESGGTMLTVEEHPTPLEELYAARISRIAGRELEGGLERVPHDRYQWFLAAGLACMAGEAGLRERRRRRRRAA